MGSITIYCDTADRDITCYHGTYATAREGGVGANKVLGLLNAQNIIWPGQQNFSGFYFCIEHFIEFDTNGVIPPGNVITDVQLIAHNNSTDFNNLNHTDVDYTVNARVYDWGDAVGTSDYIAGSQLSSHTLVATFDTTNLVNDTDFTFTSESVFKDNINLTGWTRLVLSSSRHEAGSAPGVNLSPREDFQASTGDATPSHPEQRIHLILTYSQPTQQSLSGAVGSLSGSLHRKTSKNIAGAASNLVGSLFKRYPKHVAGTVGALTGAFSWRTAIPVELAGAISSVSGALSRSVGKRVSGTLSGTGALFKRQPLHLSGSISASGTLVAGYLIFKTITGSISSISGTISPIYKQFSYAIMRAGTIIKNVIKGGNSP